MYGMHNILYIYGMYNILYICISICIYIYIYIYIYIQMHIHSGDVIYRIYQTVDDMEIPFSSSLGST